VEAFSVLGHRISPPAALSGAAIKVIEQKNPSVAKHQRQPQTAASCIAAFIYKPVTTRENRWVVGSPDGGLPFRNTIFVTKVREGFGSKHQETKKSARRKACLTAAPRNGFAALALLGPEELPARDRAAPPRAEGD